MKKKVVIIFLTVVLVSLTPLWSVVAQTEQKTRSYAEDVNGNPAVRFTRGTLKNSGDQKRARNILVLYNVAQFKLGDEELSGEFDKLEKNKMFDKKMQSIMDKLNNKKLTNSKNKKAKEILEEAGNKLYNLLAD